METGVAAILAVTDAYTVFAGEEEELEAVGVAEETRVGGVDAGVATESGEEERRANPQGCGSVTPGWFTSNNAHQRQKWL